MSAQEPAAPRPVHTPPPLDTLYAADAADSARLDSAYQRQRNTRCWRARPMPECRMVFLTDIGVEIPLSSSRSPSAPPLYQKVFGDRLNWSVGLMRNGTRHAHGVSFSLVSEDLSAFPMIAEYRYRNWLSRGHALDAGIGFRQSTVWLGSGLVPAKGYTLLLGYSPTRWLGLSVRRDEVRARGTAFTSVLVGIQSTRVSEYMFRIVAIAIVDGILARIGFERESD